MWRNYLTVGFRALARSRLYALINIFGLAIGIAASLALLLYVRYETTYDAWLPDSDRVYQVQTTYDDPESGDHHLQQGAHGVITESFARTFPQIEAISRADSARPVFMRNGEPSFADIYLVDEPFLRIVELPFLRGDPATALRPIDALVLSRTEAIRRFGGIDVVGQTVDTIRGGEHHLLRVTGVFEDIPHNSHMPFRMLGRISEADREACQWGCINGYVYLKLRPGADPDAITRGLPAWEQRSIPARNVGGARVSEGDAFDWRLVNIRDVHLSGAEGEIERPGNDRRMIATFAIVALLVLGIAVVNFVNLATARASRRAREVALRKVLGARRRQLIVQFLGESMIIAAIATLSALAMLELLLPSLSAFLNTDLTLSYLGEGGVLLPVLGLWLLVGLAGGLYPAFYLSRYQPAEVLKANQSSAEPSGGGRLRNALVVVQFAVSIGLTVCTIVIYAQTVYARTTDLGFRRDGLIQVENLNRAAIVPITETMLREVARVEGVAGVVASNISVASTTTLNTDVQIPGHSRPITIGLYSTHPDFFETVGVRRLAGRTLSRNFANDSAAIPFEPEAAREPAQRAVAGRGINIVVNALAAERMGFGSPTAAIGRQVSFNLFGEAIGPVPATIVGVVENSRFRSIHQQLEPTIFYDRGAYRTLIVHYRSSNPEAVRQAVAQVWRRLAPEVPFEGEFADEQLAGLYATDAAQGRAFAGFAMLAVAIACLGLFGLAAFTAERRTKEIGIRKVFGASTRDIVMLLVWQFTRPVVVANLIAWPVAWWVMRDWLNTFDARIDLGPGPFVVAGLLAFAIAIGTVAGHAVRVARANPILALRYE